MLFRLVRNSDLVQNLDGEVCSNLKPAKDGWGATVEREVVEFGESHTSYMALSDHGQVHDLEPQFAIDR
jgi:hypothetical protein